MHRVYFAAKHEIVPNHETTLVSSLKKVVRRVDTAAPNSENVNIGLQGRLNEPVDLLFLFFAPREIIYRHHVCSSHIDLFPVDLKIESPTLERTSAVFVDLSAVNGLLNQLDISNAISHLLGEDELFLEFR